MKVLLIGFNYRHTPVEIREQLFVDDKQATALLAELIHQLDSLHEAVLISTCNRVELYCVTDNIFRAEAQILSYFSKWFDITEEILSTHRFMCHDRDAISHLMQVSSGLDSMILGEPQILGQIGRALDSAQKISASGKILNRVFTDAIHTGKRARTETSISEQSTSVSHVAAFKVAASLLDLDNPRVLVVGAGEMAEICVRALIHHDIVNICIMNRTSTRSQALADELGVTSRQWHQLWDELALADAVITATAAPHTILHYPDLEKIMQTRTQRNLLMVDVAVPRDIESRINDLNGVNVFDIDDLQQVIDGNLAQRKACIPQVHSIIELELDKCIAWLAGLKVVPVIRDLRDKVRSVVEEELATVLHRLDHLSTEDHEAIEKFAHRIVNKVLHDPTTHLREHAIHNDSENYSQVVRDLFALDNL